MVGVSLMKAFERPFFVMILRRISSPSLSGERLCFFRYCWRLGLFFISKTALISAESAPVLMRSVFALSPRARRMASMIIDLPVPVSPVNALNPGPNEISVFSMTAIFLIERWISIFSALLSVLDWVETAEFSLRSTCEVILSLALRDAVGTISRFVPSLGQVLR